MKKHYVVLAAAVIFAVVMGVRVVAEEALTNLSVWGINNGQLLGAFADADTNATASFTKVRVTGTYASVCEEGQKVNGWCEDAADFWGVSHARMRQNIVPYGWITGESIHYSGGHQIATQTKSVYVTQQEDDPYEYENCLANGGEWDGEECHNANSPILIDTSRNPNDRYRLTSVRNGVLFDINADGRLEQIAWVANGNRVALLALDRNGNGAVDDGSELFGNYTLPGVTNGFRALAEIAPHNQDGVIDVRDPLYDQLLLWHDRNRDGVSQPSELSRVDSELEAIGLSYTQNRRRDRHGNGYAWQGWARQLEAGVSPRKARKKNQVVLSDVEREFAIYDVFLATAR